MRYFMNVCFMGLAGFFVITGCAGRQKAIQDIKSPEWVVKGSGAFSKEKGKAFYGVASASNIGNAALLRSTADNRARNEIAKLLQLYTASLMKDYAASTSAGQKNISSEEQHVEQAIKTVTAATLSGVEIVDHWQRSDTGELFSLARLDLEAFKDSLDKAKELDVKTKEYIRQNAERSHQQLEKEEEKLKGAGQ